MRLRLWLNFIEGIMSALHQIQEKAHKDGLKKNEETISRGLWKEKKRAKTINDPAEKFEFLCENCLKTKTAKFQGLYEKFCKDQANHLQALKGSSLEQFQQVKLGGLGQKHVSSSKMQPGQKVGPSELGWPEGKSSP
ncbi:uncharacterized protein LOC110753444 [Prunus avium]|uniref:Uncharacterized protein LOC110753444 n=1 Tax=Prunus avium TaxID=42229 RepID=A0A6P5S968_PRUAV|nr:uncharacterized protein LOC110753444 [Prunus avium]